ncbi:hypothetical protein ILYODFUR_035084 [Ilyodon furcidens]|uniref:Uncharacterized protein n=1 Tax=Ilyodon furcidens TaxID=33524 RepID=A0ABV0VAI4_9TELE
MDITFVLPAYLFFKVRRVKLEPVGVLGMICWASHEMEQLLKYTHREQQTLNPRRHSINPFSRRWRHSWNPKKCGLSIQRPEIRLAILTFLSEFLKKNNLSQRFPKRFYEGPKPQFNNAINLVHHHMLLMQMLLNKI